jgi:3-phosphoshikimate 1-carboxyvinyltransferase
MSAVRVSGRVRVPGDKSISHRALLFSALAKERSHIRGLLLSDDVRSTAGVLQTLGWSLPAVGPAMTVDGSGLRSPLPRPRRALDCGNSGTTTRLVAGIAAAQTFASSFTGDASLSRRPMRRVAAPLEAMGARVSFDEGRDGLPMTVHGAPLHAVDWTLPVASAQLKSAVLLAGLCGGVRVRVREPAPTRDHTERFLRAAGATVLDENGWISLAPVDRLAPVEIDVPGDPSSAAFFAVLAALADGGVLTIERIALNPQRIGFVSVLRRMGVRLEVVEHGIQGGEPIGDLVVHAGVARGTTIAPQEVPSLVDEIPVLAVLAARAEGEFVVQGAEELRVKESDRIATVVRNLRTIGADAEELPDGLVVRGSGASFAGAIETHGDHRIAMAFAVLGATRGASLSIDDPACVSVSYPSFWEDLAHVCR